MIVSQPAVVAIAGGSGAGKTTLARALRHEFGDARCCVVGQDSYYIDQSASFVEDGGTVNFDHPSSLDFDLLAEHLAVLRRGDAIDVPTYDFATHRRLDRGRRVEPRDIVLLDGTLILAATVLRPVLDVRIFVHADNDLRMQRRLARDTIERGRTSDGVIRQWDRQVQPMHDQFVEPSRVHADFVVVDDESREQCVAQLRRRFTAK